MNDPFKNFKGIMRIYPPKTKSTLYIHCMLSNLTMNYTYKLYKKNFKGHSSSSVEDGLKEEKLMGGKPARPPGQDR